MGDSYILIAISVLASVSSSYGSQDQVITTSFGKTATLQCPIANQGSDLRSLYWKKDGTAIYSLTSDGVHTSGKYSVTDTTSLAIPDVTESDGGNYSCIVAFQKPYATIKSDIMQLYVIGVSVSHCKDSEQEVGGCSCNINGSNITSLECSASGFPHPPVITWEEEDPVIYQSSSINLTRFRENITLTCKARDVNLKGVVANKTVCVYYLREVTSTGGSPVEATTASVNVRAFVATIIVLSIVLIIVLLLWLISCLAAVYKRKKGKAFHLPTCIMCTSMPKTLEEPDEPPLHGKDIGANDAGRVEHVLNVTSNWINNATLQRSVNTGDLGNPDAEFDLDRILDERDRDVCEVLVPEPESQEVTGESQIPAYQGSSVIHQSLPMPAMPSSLVPFNPRPYFLRVELQSSERAMMSNVISRIIPDGLVTGHSGISTAMFLSLPMQSDMMSSVASSVVAFNQLSPALREEVVRDLSERTAMYNALLQSILLEPGHPGSRGSSDCSTAILLGTVSVPVEQTWQEEDGIQDPLSTARLLEDKCGDSEESNNEHHDYMNT